MGRRMCLAARRECFAACGSTRRATDVWFTGGGERCDGLRQTCAPCCSFVQTSYDADSGGVHSHRPSVRVHITTVYLNPVAYGRLAVRTTCAVVRDDSCKAGDECPCNCLHFHQPCWPLDRELRTASSSSAALSAATAAATPAPPLAPAPAASSDGREQASLWQRAKQRAKVSCHAPRWRGGRAHVRSLPIRVRWGLPEPGWVVP